MHMGLAGRFSDAATQLARVGAGRQALRTTLECESNSCAQGSSTRTRTVTEPVAPLLSCPINRLLAARRGLR